MLRRIVMSVLSISRATHQLFAKPSRDHFRTPTLAGDDDPPLFV